MLNDKWYGMIKTILLKGTKKRHVPDVTNLKAIQRFYNCIAALMAQNLADMTMRSLRIYTDFLCDFGVMRPLLQKTGVNKLNRLNIVFHRNQILAFE